MLFDIGRFAEIMSDVYQQSDTPYTSEDALHVFRTYFEAYESHMKRAHPAIRKDQIWRILEEMAFITRMDPTCEGEIIEIDAFCYDEMIPRHFATKYRRCDYNINHFFSGRIRELRWQEVCN